MSPRPFARLRAMTAAIVLVLASVVSFALGVEARHVARVFVPPSRQDPAVSQRATGAIAAPAPLSPPQRATPRQAAPVKATPRQTAARPIASGARQAPARPGETEQSTISLDARRCQQQGGQWWQTTQVPVTPSGTKR